MFQNKTPEDSFQKLVITQKIDLYLCVHISDVKYVTEDMLTSIFEDREDISNRRTKGKLY